MRSRKASERQNLMTYRDIKPREAEEGGALRAAAQYLQRALRIKRRAASRSISASALIETAAAAWRSKHEEMRRQAEMGGGGQAARL